MKNIHIKNQLIIFDLDNTLINTSDVFWRVKDKFIRELAKYGWDCEEISEVFEEIEAQNIKLLGFAPERYGKSMLDSYEFC